MFGNPCIIPQGGTNERQQRAEISGDRLPQGSAAQSGDGFMVSHCANPKCAKPLHYLREGRIFVFDVPGKDTDSNGKRGRRMEHFWLCGSCSQTMAMEQTAEGVRAVPRTRRPMEMDMVVTPTMLAS
jgi:hypothetical protein